MGDIRRIKTSWLGAAPAVRGSAEGFNPESVAVVLRNTRILQSYSVEEVARAIKVRVDYLVALEEGRFNELPPIVYAAGFVGAYAHFLGLDRAELSSRFKDEVQGAPLAAAPVAHINLAPVEEQAERRTPSLKVLAAAAVLLLLAYGLWQVAGNDDRVAALEVPPLPERFVAAPAAPVTVAAPLALPEVAEVVPASQPIVILASSANWIQLFNSDNVRVASLQMRMGESYTVPPGEGLRLVAGDLSTLTIMVGGRALPAAATAGKSILSLDPTALSAAR